VIKFPFPTRPDESAVMVWLSLVILYVYVVFLSFYLYFLHISLLSSSLLLFEEL